MSYVGSPKWARREFVLRRARAKYDKHPRIVVAAGPIDAKHSGKTPLITEAVGGGAWVQCWVYLSSADLEPREGDAL